jgi:hypothetical protein
MASNESCSTEKFCKGRQDGVMGSAYGLGFIGAVIYYIQHATSFGMGFVGFLKAMVWPAFLIYKLMEYLKM